ncbi:hypothetical protein VN12_23855 [Pirellula sp. SH-Sr6A]|uniref:GNAT family N-acetyltransferase n=1 Tax=Pirellula sp. SH-Sr6A TaxID=1632865 RepID=UPI00078CF70C|nr:GNAT family N-acetyltransferase [Pirellula sp. SH-Sr6A]AMV35182.1 hypothetical protein VN12_23855 [Pirellula sp. SH-Sr6A]
MTVISPASFTASAPHGIAIPIPSAIPRGIERPTDGSSTKQCDAVGPLQIDVLSTTAEWEEIRSSWERLHGNRLNRSYPWLRSWWDAYQDEYKLHILRARYQGETIAIMPLVRTKRWLLGETLCLLGNGKACSDDLGILVQPENAAAAAHAFADYLLENSARSGKWDHLDFDGIRKGDPAMEAFYERLQSIRSIEIERRAGLSCWEASIEQGWDPYIKSLSRRVRKMLEQTQGWQETVSTFRVAQTLEEAKEMAQVIADLHQGRWAERGINGCFGTTSFESFLLKAMESLWDDEDSTHRPLVSLVTVHGEPAGGMIGFRYGGTLYIYLTGMNTKYLEYRPGWQTSFCSIREAALHGCRSVDFMRGDEDYKPRLGGLPSAQERWIIGGPRWTSRLRNWGYYQAIEVRNRIRDYRSKRSDANAATTPKANAADGE